MIFGIGIDLAKCERFEKWLESPAEKSGSEKPRMIERFFNAKEIPEAVVKSASKGKGASGQNCESRALSKAQKSAALQHLAARFAAKEAFSKALGCGLAFELRDVWIENNADGKPELRLQKTALEALKKRCPQWQSAKIFVSLSHEKEYAIAQVAIEIP